MVKILRKVSSSMELLFEHPYQGHSLKQFLIRHPIPQPPPHPPMILNRIPCLLVAALIASSGCSTPRLTNHPAVTMASTWADAHGAHGAPMDFAGGTARVAVTRVDGMDIFPQDTEPNRPWLMFGVFSQTPDDSIRSVVRFARSKGAEFLVVNFVRTSQGQTYVGYRAGRYGTLAK